MEETNNKKEKIIESSEKESKLGRFAILGAATTAGDDNSLKRLGSVAVAQTQEDSFKYAITREIPEKERRNIEELLDGVPDNIRDKYISTIGSGLTNKDEVAQRTSVRGAVFELDRINKLINQGLETVDFDENVNTPIHFLGYTKKENGYQAAPTKEYDSPIQLDVPISRDGKPYVYEVKSYPRMQFGSLPNQLNQLLKYQAAIESGAVDGATVEIKGRIHPYLLDWASGRNIAEKGNAPDVEIIYNLPLPSGAEYRFILNRSQKNNGLKFHNDKFTTEDRKIVNAIQKAIVDRSIVDIISSADIDNPSERVLPYLNNPMQITDPEIFDEYEADRLATIYDKLLKKNEIINYENEDSAYSESANREKVEVQIKEYQDFLQQNPEMAKMKKAYVLDGEEKIATAIDKTMWEIGKIRDYETTRMAVELEPGNTTRAKRAEMGYVGLPEGVALNIEHIIMDAIQETNKHEGQAGRSYANVGRFKKVEQLADYLKDQDRHYQEVSVFDPLNGKIKKSVNVSDSNISKIERDLVVENVGRAENRMEEIRGRLEELSEKNDLSSEEQIELRFLYSRMRANDLIKESVTRAKARIELLRKERNDEIMTEKDRDVKREIAVKYDERIAKIWSAMSSAYEDAVGGRIEWNKFAKRITERIDQNLIKFIYVATNDGEIVVDEEVIRDSARSGRAAHSELAEGHNVYGAGELVFSKTDGTWSLIEINNGSGHYRPSAAMLPYVKNLITSKGIDTSKTIIKDALMRGVNIQDLSITGE